MLRKAVIYPRGFLGFDIGLKPSQAYSAQDIPDLISRSRLNKGSMGVLKSSPYNETIEGLLMQRKNGFPGCDTIEFQSVAIQEAIRSFGTKNLYDWLRLQEDSPYFTSLHKQFLNDTFRFLLHGTRTAHCRTWESVVHLRADSGANQEPLQYQEYFKASESDGFKGTYGVEEHIRRWLSHAGGLDDMLYTLRIIFGSESIYTQST